jgi:hypothetical protein
MAKADKTWVFYHLPETVLEIAGSVTTKKNLETDQEEKSTNAKMALLTRADQDWYFRVNLEGSTLSDSSISLELTEDERLVTTEAKSVGRLGAIIKNIIGFVVAIVGVGTGRPLGERAKAKKDPQEEYEKEHPDLGARRRELRQAIRAIGAKLVEIETLISQTPDKTAREALRAYATDLTDGLKNLRSEAEIIEAHFSAWKARKEAARERSYEFTYRLSQLPDTSKFQEGQPVPPDLGDVREAYLAFGLIVSRKDFSVPDVDPPPPPNAPGSKHHGIYFRRPRPIELSLWTVEEDKLLRIQRRTHTVVDQRSPLGFMEFGKTIWSELSASLTLHDSGALKKLSNSKASELAAATGALKDLPADVLASLEKANKIIDEQQTLSLQGMDRRLAELKKQKEILEAEIEANGVLATAAQRAELARLKAEIDLLKARKEIGSLAVAPET